MCLHDILVLLEDQVVHSAYGPGLLLLPVRSTVPQVTGIHTDQRSPSPSHNTHGTKPISAITATMHTLQRCMVPAAAAAAVARCFG